MDDITIWNVGLPLTAIALAVLANQYLERMVRFASFLAFSVENEPEKPANLLPHDAADKLRRLV